MSTLKITKKEQQWEKKKEILEREYALREEQLAFKNKHKKRIETSKKLITFLFINCTLIELFVCYVTIKSLQVAYMTGISPDFSPLLAIVGAVVSEVIGYAIYSLKAAKENSANGIKYLVAEQEFKLTQNNSDGSVG